MGGAGGSGAAGAGLTPLDGASVVGGGQGHAYSLVHEAVVGMSAYASTHPPLLPHHSTGSNSSGGTGGMHTSVSSPNVRSLDGTTSGGGGGIVGLHPLGSTSSRSLGGVDPHHYNHHQGNSALQLTVPRPHHPTSSTFADTLIKIFTLPFCRPGLQHQGSTSSSTSNPSSFDPYHHQHYYEDEDGSPLVSGSPPGGGGLSSMTMNRSLHLHDHHTISAVSGSTSLKAGLGGGGSHAPHMGYADNESYDWIDRPPAAALHLLDLFYSSTLHQLLLLDLTSVGVLVDESGLYRSSCELIDNAVFEAEMHGGGGGMGRGARSYSLEEGSPTDGPFNLQSRGRHSENALSHTDSGVLHCPPPHLFLNEYYLMPEPHNIQALLLPSRTYHSFVRVGRVLERMVDRDTHSIGVEGGIAGAHGSESSFGGIGGGRPSSPGPSPKGGAMGFGHSATTNTRRRHSTMGDGAGGSNNSHSGDASPNVTLGSGEKEHRRGMSASKLWSITFRDSHFMVSQHNAIFLICRYFYSNR